MCVLYCFFCEFYVLLEYMQVFSFSLILIFILDRSETSKKRKETYSKHARERFGRFLDGPQILLGLY